MRHSPTPAELLALRTGNAALLNSPDAACDIVATVVFALGSAQMLQSPETAAELTARRVEDLALRGELSPADGSRRVPMELGSSLVPAVQWLLARVAELEALKPAPIQTCQTCGAGYTYGHPCSNCQFQARMAAELAARHHPSAGELAEQRHLVDERDHDFEHLAPGGAS